MQMRNVLVEGGSKRYDKVNCVTVLVVVSLSHIGKGEDQTWFATTLEEENRVNSPGKDFPFALTVSRDLSTDAFIPEYLCCRYNHRNNYYGDARNFVKRIT